MNFDKVRWQAGTACELYILSNANPDFRFKRVLFCYFIKVIDRTIVLLQTNSSTLNTIIFKTKINRTWHIIGNKCAYCLVWLSNALKKRFSVCPRVNERVQLVITLRYYECVVLETSYRSNAGSKYREVSLARLDFSCVFYELQICTTIYISCIFLVNIYI